MRSRRIITRADIEVVRQREIGEAAARGDNDILSWNADGAVPGSAGDSARLVQTTFADRIYSLIPAEVLAFYLSYESYFKGHDPGVILHWSLFGVTIVFCFFYALKLTPFPKLQLEAAPLQALLSVGAFLACAYAAGGPFQLLNKELYRPDFGWIFVAAYALFVGLFYR